MKIPNVIITVFLLWLGSSYPTNFTQAQSLSVEDKNFASDSAQPNEAETANQLYQFVVDTVRTNSLWREKVQAWPKKNIVSFKTTQEAEGAINEALSELGDKYTVYCSPPDVLAADIAQHETNCASCKMLPSLRSALPTINSRTPEEAPPKTKPANGVPPHIGYLKINTLFTLSIDDEAEARMKELKGARAIILDLRGNPGGWVDKALSIFSLFTDQGKFSIANGIDSGKPYEVIKSVTHDWLRTAKTGTEASVASRKANLLGNRPLVIIADENTASAAEMLLIALVENGVGDSVGAKTFGKAIGQTEVRYGVPGGGKIVITTFRILKPISQESIHGVGYTPHYVVKNTPGHDEQLDTAVRLLEEKLGPHGDHRSHAVILKMKGPIVGIH